MRALLFFLLLFPALASLAYAEEDLQQEVPVLDEKRRAYERSVLERMRLRKIRKRKATQVDIDNANEISFFPVWIQNPQYLYPFIKNKTQQNYYLFANSRWTFSKASWAVEVQPEIRAVQSSSSLSVDMRQSVRNPNRLMDLHHKVSSGDKQEAVTDIERLNFQYRFDTAQISIGRKPISLGVLSTFPVWNKFSRPLMTDYGPLRVFNPDQIVARYQAGDYLFQAIDIESRNARTEDAARLAEVAWFGDGAELHAIGGMWWKSATFGVALVKDLEGTSFRMEEISFADDGVQLGAGAERAFTENLSAVVEFMYLQNGAAQKRDYNKIPRSRFRPLIASEYGYIRIDYKLTALLTLQAGDIWNMIDLSNFVNAKAIYSAANDLEITGELRMPTGDDKSEFSHKVLPVQGLLGVRYDF